MSQVLLEAVRVFGVLLGALGMWAGLRAMRAQASARAWPAVTAAVVHRGVARATAANLGSPAFQFTPDVRYRYAVDGAWFESASWFPPAVHRPPRGTAAWARRLADGVPDLVVVRYDPATPSVSFLYLVPEWRLAVAVGGAGLIAAMSLVA